MEIPTKILEALGFSKPREVLKIPTDNINTSQVNMIEEYCPPGCDPKRTKLAISKRGRKDRGNFVQVYYRAGNKLAPQPTAEDKSNQFWRELNELVERNQSRGERPRSQENRNGSRR
jgi:hypothetical protein